MPPEGELVGEVLTYPGAEEFVQAVYRQARTKYPGVPRGITFDDEPTGDFGIAHCYFRSDGDLITFDTGRVPQLYVAWHELGHALSSAVTLLRGGSGFTNGLYDSFWAVRGFPGNPWDAQLKAISLGTPANPNAGYTYWPEENFADAFGAVNSYGQGSLITQNYGAYLDEQKLRSFYASLKGKSPMLTEEELNQIMEKIKPFFFSVEQKLDSGFNVTEAVQHRRVAHGKDPGTGLPGIQEG